MFRDTSLRPPEPYKGGHTGNPRVPQGFEDPSRPGKEFGETFLGQISRSGIQLGIGKQRLEQERHLKPKRGFRQGKTGALFRHNNNKLRGPGNFQGVGCPKGLAPWFSQGEVKLAPIIIMVPKGGLRIWNALALGKIT